MASLADEGKSEGIRGGCVKLKDLFLFYVFTLRANPAPNGQSPLLLTAASSRGRRWWIAAT